MSVKAVLFDLDGTLLPMDQEVFLKAYFGGIAKKLAPHGYEPQALIKAIWTGTMDMLANDGSMTNEQAFWKKFATIYGKEALLHEPIFADFYEHEFQEVRRVCGYTEKARAAVERAKALGLRTVLATSPIFPEVATRSRTAWAGLSLDDFEYYTTYENSCYSKPSLSYYKGVLAHIGLDAAECLMVGNDVGEDMVARELGMQVFLLTDCLINRVEGDIEAYPHGGFDDLLAFLDTLN